MKWGEKENLPKPAVDFLCLIFDSMSFFFKEQGVNFPLLAKFLFLSLMHACPFVSIPCERNYLSETVALFFACGSY